MAICTTRKESASRGRSTARAEAPREPDALERVDSTLERAGVYEMIERLRFGMRKSDGPESNHQLRTPTLANEHQRVVHTRGARSRLDIPAHGLQAAAILACAKRRGDPPR